MSASSGPKRAKPGAHERKEQAELKAAQAADRSSTERHEREAHINAHAADVQRQAGEYQAGHAREHQD